MCRLALFNRDMALYLGADLMEYHFIDLEDKLGGDGMGVAALNTTTRRIRVHKGVNVTPASSAQWVYRHAKRGYDYFVFHTRLATHGSVSDNNCHPFKIGSTLLAHNGSDYTFGHIRDCVDSFAIALTMVKCNFPTEWLEQCSGVFIGFRHNLPFVIKGQFATDLVYVSEGDAFMFTSSISRHLADLFTEEKSLGEFSWTGKPRENKKTVLTPEWARWDEEYYGQGRHQKNSNATRREEIEKAWGWYVEKAPVAQYQRGEDGVYHYVGTPTTVYREKEQVTLADKVRWGLMKVSDLTQEEARTLCKDKQITGSLSPEEWAQLVAVAYPRNTQRAKTFLQKYIREEKTSEACD